MRATFEEISRNSLQLPRNKRLALARFLLELDDPAEDKEASDLWHSEILKRAQAVEAGKTEGITYGHVLERVERRIENLRRGNEENPQRIMENSFKRAFAKDLREIGVDIE